MSWTRCLICSIARPSASRAATAALAACAAAVVLSWLPPDAATDCSTASASASCSSANGIPPADVALRCRPALGLGDVGELVGEQRLPGRAAHRLLGRAAHQDHAGRSRP